MTSLTIKPLTSADIPRVRALHSSLLPVNYPTSFFIQLTLLSGRVCLVAYHPANPTDPVAFISASLQENPRVNGLTKSLVFDGDTKISQDTPHIEILTLGVLPAYQQQGIARLLVQQVYDYFREHSTPSRQLTDSSLIHTNVATSNVPALSFYERIGLRVASGVIRNLYRACPHGSKDGYLLVGRLSAYSSIKSNIHRKHSKPSPAHKHNGELKQGAWKTRSRRPWTMTMIVHGFPSRLAALQFEWAWQHPHKSRHLRDSNGFALFESRRPKHLKANIQLVYQMISTHPYNTWPLHVKLFSDEAVAAWRTATRDSAPMPPGFTCSIELEGVDAKSGKVGSGRREPINIKDEQFTSSHLAKNTALLASNRLLHCSICQEELTNYTTDALSTALCPSSSCTAISHITCLSKKFLASDSSSTALIPRGGTCTSCNTYILWGDIIRGSYHRMTGGTSVEIEEEDLPNLSEDEPYVSDSEPYSELPSPNTKISKQKTKDTTIKMRKPRREARKMTFSSEGELFDFDGVISDSSTNETPRRRGRPPKSVSSATAIPKGQRKVPILQADTTQHLTFRPSIHVSSEGELFDSDSASLDTSLERSKHLPFPVPSPVAPPEIDHVPVSPRKRGRPRKVPSVAAFLPSSPPRTTKRATSEKSKLGSKNYSTAASHTVASDSSGEIFDFGAIGPGSSEDDLMLPSSGPLNGGTSRGLRSKIPGKLGSKTAQSSNRDLRGQEIEFADTTDLVRVTSSMSLSSRSPTREPRYVEISD